MNSYNLYEEKNYSTILYHAIARDEEHVQELAAEAGIDIEGLTVDLDKKYVKNELGKSLSARIEDAQVV